MAAAHSIAPFPDNIDRVAFGHWLSGFCDGEASFNLYMSDSGQPSLTPKAFIRISLRDDDAEVLRLIQSYFACGTFFGHKCSRGIPKGRRVATYSIQVARDLATVVVPHFEAFPLRAKKRRDFEIWREAVLLLYRVRQRRQGSNTRKGTRGGIAGVLLKWSTNERKQFASLCRSLCDQRVYPSEQKLAVDNGCHQPPERFLFD